MTDSTPKNDETPAEPDGAAPGKALSDAAKRALAEAAARRKSIPLEAPADERAGPKGPEPTRYGDWERKGVVSDF